MDKVVGWAFLEGLLPLASHVLCVSGRLSFELVQKAAVAGCPVLVAVGAPSSLAVELAADRGVTLCGWVRDGNVTVYSEPWRIVVGVRPHGSTRDGHPPCRRSVRAVRLAEGARAVSRRDARRACVAGSRRDVRRGRRRRKGGDGLELPFAVLDDGSEERAPVFGVIAGAASGGARDVRRASRSTARSSRRSSSASWSTPARSRRPARCPASTRSRCSASSRRGSRPASSRSEA